MLWITAIVGVYMYYVIEVFTVAIETLYISILLKGLFKKYEQTNLKACAMYVVFSLGLLVLSYFKATFQVSPIVSLAYCLISVTLLARFIFRAKWMSAFYSGLLFCVITAVVDIACSGIFMLYGVPMTAIIQLSNERVFYIVLAKLLEIFFVLVAVKLSQWRKSEDNLFMAIPLLLCQLFSIYIIYIMYLGALQSGRELPGSFLVAAVGLLYINVVIFLYVERVKKISEIKKQNELAEQLYASKLDYFNQVREDQEKTRALWHDIRKYMNTMQDMIRLNDLANARACIEQAAELFEDTGAVVDVGNTVVSAVLNHSVQSTWMFVSGKN
jgi:hypothetical protein